MDLPSAAGFAGNHKGVMRVFFQRLTGAGRPSFPALTQSLAGRIIKQKGKGNGRLRTLEFEEVQYMIEIPFLFIEFVFTSIWLAIRIGVWGKQKHIDWKREAVLLLMYINLAVIIRFVFFPMSKVDGQVQPLIFDIATAFPFRVNLVPLVNLFDYDNKRDLLLNVIGNAAMFIPS